MKIIKVKSCQECPYNGKCKAWKNLAPRQRVMLSIGNDTPHEFILSKCELEDENNNSGK